MNIPNSVKIGGFNYTISYEKNMNRDKSSFGQSCGNKQSITLDEDNTNQLQESTFLHELIHSIDFVYNVELSEKQVLLLEAGIYAFIKDNPEVFK